MPIAAETLKRFLSPLLVETGSFRGDGTQAALDAGFPRVITIEAYPGLAERVQRRFSEDPRVQVYVGSSVEHLLDILATVDTPITFFLDAHTCGGATAGAWMCPLTEELRQIATHPIKTHTILIDDVHLFGLDLPGLTEVQERLAKINPEYVISYAPSAEPSLGNDVLVAQCL